MNKQTKKHKCIFLLFIIFIFLFSCNYLCKSFGYDKDIGPAISDSAGDWYVSFYGGKTLGAINPNTGTNFVFNDFTLNPTYKWCEWTYNNTTYVVVAAATQELLADKKYNFQQIDYIHYFKYGNSSNKWKFDVVQFKFLDKIDGKKDNNVYNAIILDSCGKSMHPSAYNAPKNSQWLDIYTCEVETSNPNRDINEKFNQRKIAITDTGVFSANASQGTSATKQSGGNFILNFIKSCLTMIGDAVQILLDSIAQVSSKIMYTVDEIEKDDKLQDEVQLTIENNTELGTSTVKIDNLDNFLFVGDSITVGLSNIADAKNTTFKAKIGVGANYWLDNFSELKKIPNLKGINVFLGTNDYGWGIDNMKDLLKKLHKEYPNIPIYVDSLLPDTSSTVNKPARKTYINKLEKFCNSHKYLYYIDITSGVKRSTDGVHPTETDDGYKKLWSNLQQAIKNQTPTTTSESTTTTESTTTKATLTQGVNTSEKNKNKSLKEVTLQSTINNGNGEQETVYSAETKIPIIPVDILTCSTNQIDLFDIDLFNSSSSNSNKIWKVVRNFAAAVSHIILYISAALLLVMLIIRSIMLVIATIKDDPKGAAESKKIMDKWVKSIVLIVGIFVLMAAISNLYMVVVDMIMDGKVQKYPIRLTVENVCAFNTNVTGYIRYMIEGTNIYASFGYAILYDLVVLFNLIWVLVMFVRLIVIAAAVIIAPITTALMMLNVTPGGQNKKSIFEFKTFITVYTFFVWVPIIAVIIQRLILILG